MGEGGVGVADAADLLHDQDPAGDEAGDRAGDPDVVEAGVFVGQADLGHVQRFEAEVELLQHQLGEQLHEPRQVGDAGPLAQPVGHEGDDRQGPDVGLEPLEQPGSLHLHRHLGAIGEAGQVHLGDAGGGDGDRVDRLEGLGPAMAELGVDHRFGHARLQGRNLVAAPGEGLRPRIGQRPLGGGDELAELHVGRPAGLHEMLRPPHCPRFRAAPEEADQGEPEEPDADQEQRAERDPAQLRRGQFLRLADDAGALGAQGGLPAQHLGLEAGLALQPL